MKDKGLEENFEKYDFTAEDINFSLWIRFSMYLSGVLNRRNFLRTFCLNTNIEYPPSVGEHYHLPRDEYGVRHDRIIYIGKIRDHIILVQHERYIKQQHLTSQAINAVEQRLANERQYSSEEKERLRKFKDKLKHIADASEKLGLQYNITNQDAKIKNQTEIVDYYDVQLKTLQKIQQHNKENWDKQISILDNVTHISIKNFINTISKKVIKKLNFTKFTYIYPTYSNDAAKSIKGDF